MNMLYDERRRAVPIIDQELLRPTCVGSYRRSDLAYGDNEGLTNAMA